MSTVDIEKISLIVGLVIAIVTAIPSVIAAIKATWQLIKNKNWAKVMDIIDDAVKIAEATQKSGAQKKADVIASVTKTCKDLKIDINIQQVSDYIDQLVGWFNEMQGRNKEN